MHDMGYQKLLTNIITIKCSISEDNINISTILLQQENHREILKLLHMEKYMKLLLDHFMLDRH